MSWLLERVIVEPLQRLLERVLGFLPELLGALVIFGAGIALGLVFKTVSVRLFRTVNIDKHFESTSMASALLRAGILDRPSLLLGRLVLWFTVVCFSIFSLYSINVPAVEHLLERVLLYLPNVFAGLIIVLLGYLAGNFLARATLIAAVNAGWRSSGLFSRAVKASVILLSVTMALEQVGIGRQTTAIAFAILFGGVVLAFAIAFGFGARGIARKYLEDRANSTEDTDTLDHL